MHDSSPVAIKNSEPDVAVMADVACISVRSLMGLSLLIASTLAALALAWLWPGDTLLHFGLVAQFLPIFYALLAWWWARQPVGGDDEL